MIEPGMESTRINHIRHRQLADASESLKDRRLDDFSFVS
jgi:hypothetical protein